MNLVALQVKENRSKLKMTVLHRPGGKWAPIEVGRLANGLVTEVSGHPKHSEYLVLFGHHTKEQTLVALMGGMAYTATLVTGVDSEHLPYVPGFA